MEFSSYLSTHISHVGGATEDNVSVQCKEINIEEHYETRGEYRDIISSDNRI